MSDENLVKAYRLHAKIVLSGENKGEITEWCEPLPGYVKWSETGIAQVYKFLLSQYLNEQAPVDQNEASDRDVEYEGMTDEERRAAVYEKWENGELRRHNMTPLEEDAWRAENDRRRRIRTDNLIWNNEHHRHLVKRIHSLKDKLTKDEWHAIKDLLEACRWSDDEVHQAKEIVETAEWFSGLQR
jgi:hypothetical protein